MNRTEDLNAALAKETGRRQLAEARLADCHRQLSEARKTIWELTQLTAPAPRLSDVGVIAHAALLDSCATAGELRQNGAAAVTGAR